MAVHAGVIVVAVLVYNSGAVPERTLARAEKAAGAILAHAGVAIEWRTSGEGIPVHLLASRPPNLHYDAGGFAVLRADPSLESYAGVSYPAVVDIAKQSAVDEFVVLGAALAHELGHVLLESGAHAPSGVMAPRMGLAEVQAAARGELHFTPQEGARLRAGAARRSVGTRTPLE